ncbi:MAPEG family protein [Variovorax sp. J31P207]|uniref:MAPEG family protein n=1 Tax=Variovorax sp. J31P207 TaxID=3053510 RepID=UPI00257816C7|nr:MAPEG family protein [Variovorax sp. J31P207]MDM0066600.1 MAPEG family protein [Variovorax sp. J31P207]
MSSLSPLVATSIAILGVLLFGLGLAVTAVRGKAKVFTGLAADPDHMLNRLIRAHGNTAEYAPFLAVLFLVIGAHQPGHLALGLIAVATAARVLLAFGLITCPSMSRPNVMRAVGATLTYVTGIWLSILFLLA